MARHAAPEEGGDWREDELRSAEGRVRKLRPLLSLPWTPADSATAADWLRACTVIGYQEANQVMDSPAISMACRVHGLPPVTVDLQEVETTPGNCRPGTRGYEAYFKLPADSVDMDFGQLSDDYMGGDLPTALTAEERAARALKLQSLMACFHTATHLLQQKKESLGALCKLWAGVQRPADAPRRRRRRQRQRQRPPPPQRAAVAAAAAAAPAAAAAAQPAARPRPLPRL